MHRHTCLLSRWASGLCSWGPGLGPGQNDACFAVMWRINDDHTADWPKKVSYKCEERQAGCGQRARGPEHQLQRRGDPPPPHSIRCSSPGLLFLGRATHHMSEGRHHCCWDDVTVYFEGHTGASVSLASHTLYVSSLRAGDTQRSTNSA